MSLAVVDHGEFPLGRVAGFVLGKEEINARADEAPVRAFGAVQAVPSHCALAGYALDAVDQLTGGGEDLYCGAQGQIRESHGRAELADQEGVGVGLGF